MLCDGNSQKKGRERSSGQSEFVFECVHGKMVRSSFSHSLLDWLPGLLLSPLLAFTYMLISNFHSSLLSSPLRFFPCAKLLTALPNGFLTLFFLPFFTSSSSCSVFSFYIMLCVYFSALLMSNFNNRVIYTHIRSELNKTQLQKKGGSLRQARWNSKLLLGTSRELEYRNKE